MKLKDKLLSPQIIVANVKILGVECSIKRLSAERIQKYNDAVNQAQKSENTEKLNQLSIELMLDALVDENGNAYSKDELPTYKELMSVHDSASLIDAVAKVQRHSVGTIEDAEKN